MIEVDATSRDVVGSLLQPYSLRNLLARLREVCTSPAVGDVCRVCISAVGVCRFCMLTVGDVCRACVSAEGGVVCGHADEGQGPAGVG